MTPTLDFLNAADKRIRVLLQELRPQLLEAHGVIEHKLKGDKLERTIAYGPKYIHWARYMHLVLNWLVSPRAGMRVVLCGTRAV